MPNNYPMYYPYPTYPQYQPPTPSVTRKAELVQGRAAAEVYQVKAGEEVFLIDEDNPCVYRKARGFDGTLQQMETYDLMRHEETEQKPLDLSSFITSEDFESRINNEIEQRIKEEVDKRISEISFTPAAPKRTTAKKGE